MRPQRIKKEWLGLVTLVACFAVAWQVWASGLAVSPASYNWHNVVPGSKPVKVIRLKIMNQTDSQQRYALSVVIPIKGETGFLPLPDSRWVALEKREVVISAQSSTTVPVSILVPKGKKNQGRSWLFYLAVKEQATEKKRVLLACYPKVYVKTVK